MLTHPSNKELSNYTTTQCRTRSTTISPCRDSGADDVIKSIARIHQMTTNFFLLLSSSVSVNHSYCVMSTGKRSRRDDDDDPDRSSKLHAPSIHAAMQPGYVDAYKVSGNYSACTPFLPTLKIYTHPFPTHAPAPCTGFQAYQIHLRVAREVLGCFLGLRQQQAALFIANRSR